MDGPGVAVLGELALAPRVAFLGADGAGPARARCLLTWPAEVERPSLAAVVDVFTRLGVDVLDHARPAAAAGQPAADEYLLALPEPPRRGDEPAELAAQRARDTLGELLGAVWTGAAELDGLTRLALTAGVAWREVAVVRAAWRFLYQTGVGLSHGYAERTLHANPGFVHALLEYFRARFDPDGFAVDRDRAVSGAAGRLDALLASVSGLDEDRILRGLRDVLAAVVRTNYYQRDAAGQPRPALALKIASERLTLLPPPRPWMEIFVTSPTVEGVHLRGARVARGGLRHSDRREDYRTEVHGLYRAQVTKNVVIVPDGAKGAFVLRGPATDAAGPPDPARVRAAYRTFVSALLDVTDNLVGGRAVHPERTVVYDGPDTYLVVAADRGTATFSDLANEIALERGYWLGDAFASGGSTGYDHKAMGITARGAWESVRRHLRELGMDADRDAYAVVGIGDMSGDVFGNGMLLSSSFRLIAAFDHRHVLVDPDPDPAASYAERARLARLPNSSWADYDPKALSPGGGVYRRDARRVVLSARARQVLGLPPVASADDGGMTPAELIRAVLQAPVDLLYNGGIGTYIKAGTESHDDAADHANDAVRVDAGTVRARVVVEGGNLGVTQAARVELARLGVRINTDFLDNSAGVDTSDREVNLKILLDGAVADGELTRAERDELLRSLADEVAAAVIDDSAQQVAAVSLSSAYAPYYLDRHIRLLRNLEARTGLIRALEHLPSEARLERLRAAHGGLTRPELAVLQARAKLLVRLELLETELPDEPAIEQVARRYFPAPVRRRFAARISAHPLLREIIATRLANELVNRMGPGFVFRLEEQAGVTTADTARAYAAAGELFGLDELWPMLEHAGTELPAAEELAARRAAREYHELATEWLLRHARGRDGTAAAARLLREPAAELVAAFGVAGPAAGDLRARIAGLRPLGTALDLLVMAPAPAPAAIAHAAGVHVELGRWLGLSALYERLDEVFAESHWVLTAKAALRAQLTQLWATLDWLVLAAAHDPADDPEELVYRWLVSRPAAVAPFTAVLAELAGEQPSGVPPADEPWPGPDNRGAAARRVARGAGTGPIEVAAATVALHELRLMVERAQLDRGGLGPRLRARA